MTIMESLYQCNMCGKEMKHKTPKLVMGEYDGDSFEKLDIHLCLACKPVVIDYINGNGVWNELPEEKETSREEIAKTKVGKKWVGNLHRASAIVSAPEFSETEINPKIKANVGDKLTYIQETTKPKKKHEFYGNQYLLRNRKSRK